MEKQEIINTIKQNPNLTYKELKSQANAAGVDPKLLKQAWKEAKKRPGIFTWFGALSVVMCLYTSPYILIVIAASMFTGLDMDASESIYLFSFFILFALFLASAIGFFGMKKWLPDLLLVTLIIWLGVGLVVIYLELGEAYITSSSLEGLVLFMVKWVAKLIAAIFVYWLTYRKRGLFVN